MTALERKLIAALKKIMLESNEPHVLKIIKDVLDERGTNEKETNK